jgi:hypothetical protein
MVFEFHREGREENLVDRLLGSPTISTVSDTQRIFHLKTFCASSVLSLQPNRAKRCCFTTQRFPIAGAWQNTMAKHPDRLRVLGDLCGESK